jgi:Ala-tRNA(Pro) deacylase
MPVAKLKEFLDAQDVNYTSIRHTQAYTAVDIARSAHLKDKDLAKTVMLKMDGRLAMAVLPASRKVHVERLRRELGARSVVVAREEDFQDDFPGCELGAMPPFGNLFRMDVYVEPHLAEDREIAFNAGSHSELVQMNYKDFERLVHPRLVSM